MREKNRQTHRHTDRETDRETNSRQTDRWMLLTIATGNLGRLDIQPNNMKAVPPIDAL
jgi:hypothetical protein